MSDKKVWFTRCPVPTATSIGIRKGFLQDAFAAHGYDFVSLRHSKNRNIRESHFTHNLEMSFRHGGNTPALFAKSEGADTYLLALNPIKQYQGILTLPDSGIKTLADLKGKKVALPWRKKDKIDFWRATQLQSLENLFKHHGFSISDIELVDIEVNHSYLDVFTEVADEEVDVPRLSRQHLYESLALIRGEVDAMLGYSVWGVDLRERLGLHEVVSNKLINAFEFSINNGYPETLTVSGDVVRNAPELIDVYFGGLEKSLEYAKNNSDAVCRILASEAGVAEFWISEGTSTEVSYSLSNEYITALELRKNFLIKNGFLKNDFSIQDWIYQPTKS